MVKVALQLKATLVSIDKLYTNHPEYQWYLKLKCSNCGECRNVWHNIIESERFIVKNRRSATHFIAKCKLCLKKNTFDIIKGSNGEYLSSDSNKFKTLVVFECRGLLPVEFSPGSGWIVKSEENGKKFKNVDLSMYEWADFDKKKKKPVCIYNMEFKFIKSK